MVTLARKLGAVTLACLFIAALPSALRVNAATTPDAVHLISLTASAVAKQLGTQASHVRVTKLVLTDNYAIASWSHARSAGQKIFHKQYQGDWELIGSDTGQATTASLAVYDVPVTTATGLVAAEKNCPSPAKVTFEGQITLVCFVGPCSAC
jgi:hypothetical protein